MTNARTTAREELVRGPQVPSFVVLALELEDSQDTQLDDNDYDGDNQTEDTAHGISLPNVSGTLVYTMSPHNV